MKYFIYTGSAPEKAGIKHVYIKNVTDRRGLHGLVDACDDLAIWHFESEETRRSILAFEIADTPFKRKRAEKSIAYNIDPKIGEKVERAPRPRRRKATKTRTRKRVDESPTEDRRGTDMDDVV